MVLRRIVNRLFFLVFAQICVKPRKSNVSGLPSSRRARFAVGKPTKLNEAGFLRVQGQAKPGHTLP